jgi:hypothetical protein
MVIPDANSSKEGFHRIPEPTHGRRAVADRWVRGDPVEPRHLREGTADALPLTAFQGSPAASATGARLTDVSPMHRYGVVLDDTNWTLHRT